MRCKSCKFEHGFNTSFETARLPLFEPIIAPGIPCLMTFSHVDIFGFALGELLLLELHDADAQPPTKETTSLLFIP